MGLSRIIGNYLSRSVEPQKRRERKSFQESMEKNVWGFAIMIAIVVSIGGIVEIVPLFYLDNTIEKLTKEEDGIRPYTALELEGRDIYIREGCYLCHSQMIRPFRDEKERYGHYSLAAESKYDHPFQWGSKRTGPDLARVGGKYSNEWQIQHLRAPRSLVPESVMPNYAFLERAPIDDAITEKKLRAMAAVGVPYSEADFAGAAAAVRGKNEMDALIAYMQVLGTMVKFEPGKEYRE
ncbi:MAG: cytochrome-c oxidase, cbb3-type subunit II [Zetaproteobacteria bacterium CG_4_9_14_3_um_filter_49_83]|nr:MAG: cytochrome-c oxidase, cbb3-type subunit II [Zetaproteobacteria bacterium CG17_big_fil_post_rev_8_21_14_2_50_50_13]PIY54537.1 MAG: cytochrome-c oxidase, cbb3-type subunit II [Zetaproteobacteria bacterium CG_4_10_14_0_8_um_filter_49_80]PJA36469.1 MAG: cytochrome-c oxidase, cbb3-type subunit II [Zetaproteobacteria bacterium CG_4_9_14_3_um_filter_49_83]